jgi:hypothetical protein
MIGESSRISMLRCTNAEDMVTIVSGAQST